MLVAMNWRRSLLSGLLFGGLFFLLYLGALYLEEGRLEIVRAVRAGAIAGPLWMLAMHYRMRPRSG